MRKVALITGSSRGIGRAEALRFSRKGYAVAVNYIESKDKAEEVVHRIRQAGNDAQAYQADVSDADAVSEMVSSVEKDLGPVEVLVNNAGIAKMSQFQDITPELWQRMFAVNLNGAFNTIQAVLPHMLHVHAGVIVNTSSIWGEHGASCEVAYSSTKHAIIGLTKSLAMELAPTGIRVNCVAPGVINTDMVQVLGEETLDMLKEETPLSRLGTPEDIAALVEFLASDEASFITGQVFTCDGGFKNV
jgi:3-oxoacyl-[acyl-carrier protein] reductase